MEGSSNMAIHWGKAVVIAVLIGIAGYWSAFGWLVYSAPLTFRELDLNHDGEVTFDEASYAASFGERAIKVDGQQCKEYFAFKDGLPLKVVCPARA